MPRSYDSDSEEEPVLPPLTFTSADRETYEHLIDHLIVDARTGQQVDGATVIASLFTDTGRIRKPALLRNVTCVAEPKVPCQIQVEGGKVLPWKFGDSRNSYSLHITYNRLLIAPVVRLEVAFVDFKSRDATPYHTIVLEFHFNDYIEGDNDYVTDMKIEHYRHTRNTLTFSARHATCSGFNLLKKFESKFTMGDREIIQVLKSFTVARNRPQIYFHLHEEGLDPSELSDLADIRSRLPGGSRRLLPSIGIVEYHAFGPEVDHIWCKAGGMRKPRALMAGAAPFPAVALQCGPTFSTMKQAQVELGYAAHNTNAEEHEALALWAEPNHKVHAFLLDKFVVVGVKFNRFSTLSNQDAYVDFKLPSDLECTFTVHVPGKHRPGVPNETVLGGILMSCPPGRGVDAREDDAFFHITSHFPKYFKKTWEIGECIDLGSVHCRPHYSSFTYSSQLETVSQLAHERNERWRPILLNQRHDSLKPQDMTVRGLTNRLPAVDDWIRKAIEWNKEQLEVIDGVRKAKGGMMLVMGPAATGKTLLQRFLILYFYYLGYHVLAVAPANDNVNKLARDLDDYLEWIRSELKKGKSVRHWLFDFLRLFPGSRDIDPEEMDEEQAKYRKVGHEGGQVLSWNEFLIALNEQKKEKVDHRKHGVAETIIRHANEKNGILKKSVLNGNKKELISKSQNVYDVLREFMDLYRRNKVDWDDKDAIEKYKAAYDACKGKLVAMNRIMITTTGNVRSRELLDYWYGSQYYSGPDTKGVIVITDEGPKDFEVNLWSPIVCEKWAKDIAGVLIFGDEKQLQPPNTCSRGKVMFNYYRDRLDITLPSRLVQEGFPVHILSEQRRMHPVLARFPADHIYPGKLKSAPGRNISINAQMPGLREVLIDIIAGTISSPTEQAKFKDEVTDDDLRRHYVEVSGKREKNPVTHSSIVYAHVDVFFSKIFPKLRQFFREKRMNMQKEVMIICAYGFAVGEYKKRFQEMREKNSSLTADGIPRVVTIDSSQGDESFIVFFDASAQHCNDIGFMENRNRFNVAITRAKAILWTIGGAMKTHPWKTRQNPHNLPSTYKAELDQTGVQKHHFLIK